MTVPMKKVQRCTRCIMDDSSDETIRFDENGVCNYCTAQYARKEKVYFPGAEGEARLKRMIEEIKQAGKGRQYDCIMGLSGGLDSSYLAMLGFQRGLRVLAVHIDDGFDTDISKENLRKLIAATGFDYEVIQPDAEQYNALTRAYLKASVANISAPQDNILFAFLYSCMKKYHIRYFLSGSNFALECILQIGGSHNSLDLANILDINRKFGTEPVDKLKFLSSTRKVVDRLLYGIKTYKPLNLIDYNRDRAFCELADFCGFEYYGRKHLENILTAFLQLYWMPKKFGVDKRTSHLSSMIVSGQMTREQALKEYAEALYDEKLMEEYISFIREKLNISKEEFQEIMDAPPRLHTEFKTSGGVYKVLYGIRDRLKLYT